MKQHTIVATIVFTLIVVFSTNSNAANPILKNGQELAEIQTFTYRLLDEIPTLDPQLNEDSEGFDVLRDLFEGLLNQDSQGKLEPGVAKQFQATDSNRTFIFELREDAKWSNGEPVTAHDFVYSWRRAVNPATASPYSWYVELATVKNAANIIAGNESPENLGVRALDDFTLEVRLEQPLPYFPEMTTYATFFPVHRATVETHGAKWTKPENMISNGAYVLTEHAPNEFHSRERNPHYWNNEVTVIEKVIGRVVNDENQALTRYFADELDYTGIPTGQFPKLKEKYPNEATSVPILCTYYYAINHTDSSNPALKDVRIRKALSYALDRNLIVNQVLKGGQYPAYSFTHRATAGFAMPEIDYAKVQQSELDSEAKKLMEAAGYGAGNALRLKLIYNTSESHKQIATVVSQLWKQKLGVKTELQNFEWKTYLDIRRTQQFDIARSAWCGDYNEASTFLDLMTTVSTSNSGKFSNAEVDRLMKESKTLSNPQDNYTKVELILANEMALIPIYHYTSVFMLKPQIKGWSYDNVQQLWYSKNLYRVNN